MKTLNFDFYTQYNQFYICDKDSPGQTDSADFWTDAAFNDRLAKELGILGVGTECYGPVKGEIVFLDKKNEDFDIELYDHIVEAGLQIQSGTIQILDCPNSSIELEINIAPDFYKFRIYSSNLASVEGDEGDDFYRIEFWKDLNLDRKVLKRYN
ncbi:MAG: hypothetical protein IT220_04855 [Flavobacteriaceae bacterium]|nr:hypothetical protein [Flavobacteriaceae bacterium]